MKFILHKKKGFSLIEVLVACTILSVSILSLISASTKGVQVSRQALRQTQAVYLLEEGGEAVKSMRNDAWNNISSLTIGTTYYLSFNSGTGKWTTTTTANSIDSIFTRTVVLSTVNRDITNDDIVSSGGTVDTLTKKVSVTVSYTLPNNTTSTKTLSFYISDIFS